jgi:MtN3 and saliva related transmembrane protein
VSKFWIVAIGVVVALCTTGAWLPQLWKTWRTGSARDFSWGYLALFSTGVALWAIYGVLRDDVAVIGANVVTIVLVVGVIAVKLRE